MNRNEPLKWRKYNILCDFGLRDYDDLTNEIHRFKICDVDILINELKSKLIVVKQNISIFIVIKLVNREAIFNLPNYRIYTLSDLIFFQTDIKQKKCLYHEVWYCETIISNNNKDLNVAGRILFTGLKNGYEQTVEQIWNRSPRIIDEFCETSDFIFVRADRRSWGMRHTPTTVHLPSKYSVNKGDVLTQFYYIMGKIEKKKETVEMFEHYMLNFGFRSFSLEYKITNDRFTFIDWDTPNDRLVLNANYFQ